MKKKGIFIDNQNSKKRYLAPVVLVEKLDDLDLMNGSVEGGDQERDGDFGNNGAKSVNLNPFLGGDEGDSDSNWEE